MFEKFAQIALLFDFYGNLLTEKQQEMLTLYYEDNLSLGEIATEYNISRQAVYDILKRAEKTLLTYETKLALAARFEKNKETLQEIIVLCNEIKMLNDISKVDRIIEKVSEIGD